MDATLQAYTRIERKKANQQLRANGYVPGVVYGQGEEALAVSIPEKELAQMYYTAGSNRLVEVKIDDTAAVNTLFVDVQTHPISGAIQHFDMYKVKMDEEIDAEIPIQLEGEAPATYNLGGVLVQNLESIEVRSLPGKLPESFVVNLEELTDINDSVHISNLDIPDGVEVLAEDDELVVKVDPPRSEEELEELEEAIDEDAEEQVAAQHGDEEEAEDSDQE